MRTRGTLGWAALAGLGLGLAGLVGRAAAVKVGVGTGDPKNTLHVGAGTLGPVYTYEGLHVAPASGGAQVSVRGGSPSVEMGLFAHPTSGIGYLGTWTGSPMRIRTNNSDRVIVSSQGHVNVLKNFGMGTSTFGTNFFGTPVGIVAFLARDWTEQPNSVPSVAQLHCWHGGSPGGGGGPPSAELWVTDGDGNATGLSSHSRRLLPEPDPEVPHPWSYHTWNAYLGVEQNVDMAGVIRAVEELTGKQFIYWAALPVEMVRDWDADQAAAKVRIDAERLEAALAEAPDVAVSLAEAWEWGEEVVETPVEVERTVYELDLAGESIRAVTVKETVLEARSTGERVKRLKPGVWFDPGTGRLWRRPRPHEVAYEPYTPAEPPAWLAARMAR